MNAVKTLLSKIKLSCSSFVIFLFLTTLCACSNQGFINEQVEQSKVSLPLKIDDQTTWVDIKGMENAFVYIYSLSGESDQDFITSKDKIKNTVIKRLKQSMNKDIEIIFDKGIYFHYKFINENGIALFSFDVYPKDLTYKK